MVSARFRFTGFLLILSILLPSIFSRGHALQAKKTMALATTGIRLQAARSSNQAEQHQIYNGVPAVVEIDQSTKLGEGRKMMSKGISTEVETEHRIAVASTRNGKANCLANCDHGRRGILNVKRSRFSKRNRHPVHVKMSGLVPLNADYHVPRPHPPKNN